MNKQIITKMNASNAVHFVFRRCEDINANGALEEATRNQLVNQAKFVLVLLCSKMPVDECFPQMHSNVSTASKRYSFTKSKEQNRK